MGGIGVIAGVIDSSVEKVGSGVVGDKYFVFWLSKIQWLDRPRFSIWFLI